MGAAVCLALGSAGCGEQEPPIRVAVLTECIGTLEASKESILAAAQLPFIERGARAGDGPCRRARGRELGGRPVEMLVGCTLVSNLSGLIIEVRRLIESGGADVIVGPVGDTEGIIVRRLAARYPNVTFVLGASGAQATTLSDPQPNLFRFVADGAQKTAGLAAHAYTDLGWRRAALVMDPPTPQLGIGGRLRGRVLRARRHSRVAARAPGGACARRRSGGPRARGTARARGRWHAADHHQLQPRRSSCVHIVAERHGFHSDWS